MWSKATLPLVAIASLQAYSASAQKLGVPKPSTIPIPDQVTSQGCYSSGGNLTLHKNVEYVSSGSCGDECRLKQKYVMALHGAQCYCGMEYPPKDSSAQLNKCSYPCPGFDQEACGGIGDPGYWSVFNTGVEVDVPNSEPEEEDDDDDNDSETSGSSETTATKTAADSAAVTTIIETSSATESESDSDGEKKGGPNTAGIAAGVVVGVVAIGAGVGGFFFWMRRRRNAEIEEDHRRNAAVNAFINGSKPPGSSGSISMSDSRLDPVMAHRRMSDGSIADNQDYSRRILRVTNA